MRANLDYCNRNILTKKFWSHVKSSKNSSRIPEVIPYEGLTANEPLAKANMFNTRIAIMMTKVPSHQKIMILIGLE